MLRPTARYRSYTWPPLDVILEESSPIPRPPPAFTHDPDLERDDIEYRLDLGSGSGQSSPCLSLSPVSPRRRLPSRAFRPSRSALGTRKARAKEAARDCAICFELAVSPVRTRCCTQLFCAEHIAHWLRDPGADGRCPCCRKPDVGAALLALGHPAEFPLSLISAPPAPPPSRAPSPTPLEVANDSAAPYVTYQKTPVAPPNILPEAWAMSRPDSPTDPLMSSTRASPLPSDCSKDEDDSTLILSPSFSLPLLVHARALQTRRHAPHPFAYVLGVRGALLSTMRVALWVILVGVLAMRAAEEGRWGADVWKGLS